MATSGTSADAGALPASEAPVDSALPRATAGPAGIVVRRPVRAYPRQVPAGGLTVASPPTVAGNASSLAGWLQYLVPLVGSGGSLAFLFAVPGPRPAWLVALVAGAAVVSVVAGLALLLVSRPGTPPAQRREPAPPPRPAPFAGRAPDAPARQAPRTSPLPQPPQPDRTPGRPPRRDPARRRRARPSRPAPAVGHRRAHRPAVGAPPRRRRRPCGPNRPRPSPTGRPHPPRPTPDPLVEHDPELLAAAVQLVRRATRLPDAPVVIPLAGPGVVALTGPPDRARALARAIACELAAFH